MAMNLSTIDDNAEVEDLRWEHYCNVAKRIDPADIIDRIAEEIQGESEETPISALVEGWLEAPEPDWSRPTLSAYLAERIGRHVAAVAAKIIEAEIDKAVEQSFDRDF